MIHTGENFNLNQHFLPTFQGVHCFQVPEISWFLGHRESRAGSSIKLNSTPGLDFRATNIT